MAKDKAKAPIAQDNPADNGAFAAEMFGGQESHTLDSAAALLAGSEGLIESLLSPKGDDDQDHGDEDDQDTLSDDQGDDEGHSDEGDDEDYETDDDGQGDEPPNDKSDDGVESPLLIRDDNGKLKSVGLDEVTVPITLDGEEQELTLAEIQREFTDNRLRRSDYTRKTQELSAKVRNEVDKAVGERQAQLDRGYEQLDVVLSAFGADLDKDVSFDELKAQYGGDIERAGMALTQRQAIRSSLAKAKSDMEARRQETLLGNVQVTLDAIRADNPAWSDQSAFDRDLTGLREYFLNEGLGDDDIVSILQKPAYTRMALAAMQGDKLRKKTAQKPKTVKKTIRLGSSKTPVNAAEKRKAGNSRKSSRVSRNPIDVMTHTGGQGLSEADAIAMLETSVFGGK